MESKDYKLIEDNARYIYEKFATAGFKVKIVWNNGSYGVVLLKDTYASKEYYDLMTAIEDKFGLKIFNVFYVTADDKELKTLWNKEKEKKYFKKQRDQVLRLNEFKDELAFMEFYGALFHKAVEEVFVKKK